MDKEEKPRTGNATNSENGPNLGMPPYSNTGAQDTLENAITLDWCAFTVPSENTAFSTLNIPENSFTKLEKGLMGYSKTMILGDIKIYYDGTPEMGTHIVMSGKGCRQFEALNPKPWSELAQRVKIANGKFARIDLAIDSFDDSLKMSTMEAKIRRGCVKSPFKKARSYKEMLLLDGSYTGKTLYFGAATSQIQIRIYDKHLEQISKGIENVPPKWIRVELQCRDDRAEKITEHIIFDQKDDIGSLTQQYLKNYLNFLVKNPNDLNKARWEICEFWQKFLNDLPGLSLVTKPKPRTMEKIEFWVRKQVVPSLAMLSLNSDGEFNNLTKIIKMTMDAKERLKEKDFAIIRSHEQEKILRRQLYNAIGQREKHRKIKRKVARKRINTYHNKLLLISEYAPGVTKFKQKKVHYGKCTQGKLKH